MIPLSISSGSCGRTPEHAVRNIAAAGFRFAELCDGHSLKLLMRGEDAWKKFRKYAESSGVCFRQGHLPLDRYISEPDDAKRTQNMELHRSVCRMYHVLGITAAVLHTGSHLEIRNGEPHEAVLARQAEALKELLSDLPDGMTVCLENIPVDSFDSMEELVKAAGNPDNLGYCLDSGHLHLSDHPDPVDFIRRAGTKLKALHLQDNVGPLFSGSARTAKWVPSDKHMFPVFCKGSIDWIPLIHALKDVGYQGLWNLEVAAGLSDVKLPGEAYREFILKQFHDQAKFLFEYDPDAPGTSDPVNDMSVVPKITQNGVTVERDHWHLKISTAQYVLEVDPVHSGRICRWFSQNSMMLVKRPGTGWGIPGIWWPQAASCLFLQGMKLQSVRVVPAGIEIKQRCVINEDCSALTGCVMDVLHTFFADRFSVHVQIRNVTDEPTVPFAFRFCSNPRFLGGDGVSPGTISSDDGKQIPRDGSIQYCRIGKEFPELECGNITELAGNGLTLRSADAPTVLRISFSDEPPAGICFWDSPAWETTFEPVYAPKTLASGEACNFEFTTQYVQK